MSGFGVGSFGGSFSAAPFYNTSTMIDSILKATAQATSDADARARTLEYINTRYLQILKSRHWAFLERHWFMDLLAPKDDGTVSATLNDQTVTGSGTNFDATMVNQRLVIGTNRAAFEIQSITSTTELELYNKFPSTTVTGQDYKVIFPRYELPTDLANIRSIIVNGQNELVPVGPQEMHLMMQSNQGYTGVPKYYTITEMEKDSNQWYLEIYPSPDQAYAVTIDYSLHPQRLEDTTTSYFLFPDYHSDVLYYGTLADTYRYLENDSGFATAFRDYQQSLSRLYGDDQLTDSRVILKPARNYNNRVRGRRRWQGFFGLKWFGKVED